MSAQRAAAIALAAAAIVVALTLPCGAATALMGCIAVTVLSAWKPPIAIAALAAGLPGFDLTPYTGRFYVNEMDALVLAALAGTLWTVPLKAPARAGPSAIVVFGWLLLVSYLAGLVIGATGDRPAGVEWGNAYDHPLNAVRVARPALYAAGLAALLIGSAELRTAALVAFSAGSTLGLAAVVWSVGRERLAFCGLVDLDSEYRVTGPFADMHTGGAYLDAYLVLATPMVVLAWTKTQKALARTALLLLLLLGAAYATCVTLSRTPIVILGVQASFIALFWPGVGRSPLVAILRVAMGMGAVALLALVVIAAPAVRQRFQTLEDDSRVRLDHWSAVVELLPENLSTQLFGNGCGQFPRTQRAHLGGGDPRDYQFRSEGGDSYLRLNLQSPIYLGQWVDTRPETLYQIVARCRRVSGSGPLSISLCEKGYLSSYEKVGHGDLLASAKDRAWMIERRKIHSGPVGRLIDRSPLPEVARPVALSLWAPRGTVVDLDEIQLLDEQGTNLLANGDFAAGHDCWWWTADDHLSWHAKNLAVHLLVEQGWIGLVAFAGLLTSILMRLAGAIASGSVEAVVVTGALGGVLAVGIIDSVIDSPRVALLFYLLATIAACAPLRAPASPVGEEGS